MTIHYRYYYNHSTNVLTSKTLGGANVWTNFSYGYRNESSSGWLLNPKGSLLRLFEEYKKSPQNKIKVYTHLFYANHLGKPYKLKNTRLLDLDFDLQNWN